MAKGINQLGFTIPWCQSDRFNSQDGLENGFPSADHYNGMVVLHLFRKQRQPSERMK